MEDKTLKPGLTCLNLNILQIFDLAMIDDVKASVEESIKEEHPIVSNALKNVIAVLKTKIPRQRIEAVKLLENIVRENPKHLNALADLEKIYRESSRVSDADAVFQKIRLVLQGTSTEDIQSKSTCLLEQAFVIRLEKTLVNENAVSMKMSELHKTLVSEFCHSEGEKRKSLFNALRHSRQVINHLNAAKMYKTSDGHHTRYSSSIDKFENADKICSDISRHPAWQFNYAKTLNQYYDTLEEICNPKSPETDKTKEMAEVTIKAIDMFWRITQDQSEEMKIYVARSFSYLGHILVKRKKLVYQNEDRMKKFPYFSSTDFQRFLKNPMSLFEEGMGVAPGDTTVLNRYGRSLRMKALMSENNKELKLKCLNDAERILSKSIALGGSGKWWAQSTRMLVRLELAKSTTDRTQRHLEDAKRDGEECFRFKGTMRDMTYLADICQKLAKFPDINEHGPKFVKFERKHYLHEALEYLHYGSQLGEQPGFRHANIMASCLCDLDEYDKAMEWQLRACLLANDESKLSCSLFRWSLDMLVVIESHSPQPDAAYLNKFIYIFEYAKYILRFGEMESIYRGLFKKKRDLLITVVKEIIDKNINMSSNRKEILNEMLSVLKKLSSDTKYLQEISELENTLLTIISDDMDKRKVEDLFERDCINVNKVSDRKAFNKHVLYDFFVSHSHKDEDWVNNILVPQLEGAFDEHDVSFAGCVANRDFEPGRRIFDNITHAIAESEYIILVLTPHYLSSEWCRFEMDQALSVVFDKTCRKRIIPVLLKECKIPKELSTLTYIDLSNGRNSLPDIQKLKDVLLGDESY